MKKSNVMLAKDFQSSFLSVEKDSEQIIRKLFIESQPYSEELKRLLVINTKDCLDEKDSQVYQDILSKTTLNTLQEKGYIQFALFLIKIILCLEIVQLYLMSFVIVTIGI